MTTDARQQALADLQSTCEDLADLEEAFRRGRLSGLQQAAEIADELAKIAEAFRQFKEFAAFTKVALAIQEQIAEQENAK